MEELDIPADWDWDGEMTQVRTKAPTDDADRWKATAKQLNMTRNRFLYYLIKAGEAELALASADKPGLRDLDPRDELTVNLQTQILEAVDDDADYIYPELVEEVQRRIEGEIEDAIDELAADGVLAYERSYIVRNGGDS